MKYVRASFDIEDVGRRASDAVAPPSFKSEVVSAQTWGERAALHQGTSEYLECTISGAV